MSCKNCKIKPVITLVNNNKELCKSCFLKYFERKFKKTIRLFNLVDKNDRIGVAVSGGKDSMVLLYLLNKIFKNHKMELVAISVDEGIQGYRDKTLEKVKEFCNKNKIEHHIYSYKEEFGKTLDKTLKDNKDLRSCSICGVFRRTILNKKSKELKLTKLALGHNLDDEVQTILMNQFRNNPELNARGGPITGIKQHKEFIQRIKPLYFLTEKEVMTFAYLKDLVTDFTECPHSNEAYRNSVRDFINNFEKKYPGTRHSIVNSFIQILPILKENFKNSNIQKCKICKEPCSGEICRACIYKELINEN